MRRGRSITVRGQERDQRRQHLLGSLLGDEVAEPGMTRLCTSSAASFIESRRSHRRLPLRRSPRRAGSADQVAGQGAGVVPALRLGGIPWIFGGAHDAQTTTWKSRANAGISQAYQVSGPVDRLRPWLRQLCRGVLTQRAAAGLAAAVNAGIAGARDQLETAA
jgi:hypothetical protein